MCLLEFLLVIVLFLNRPINCLFMGTIKWFFITNLITYLNKEHNSQLHWKNLGQFINYALVFYVMVLVGM